jgi:hypothetical protein
MLPGLFLGQGLLLRAEAGADITPALFPGLSINRSHQQPDRRPEMGHKLGQRCTNSKDLEPAP